MCIKPDQARSPHMGANPAKAMTDRVKSLIELFLQFLKCLNNPYILSYDLLATYLQIFRLTFKFVYHIHFNGYLYNKCLQIKLN